MKEKRGMGERVPFGTNASGGVERAFAVCGTLEDGAARFVEEVKHVVKIAFFCFVCLLFEWPWMHDWVYLHTVSGDMSRLVFHLIVIGHMVFAFSLYFYIE
jgi:hypothetical protein